MRVFNKIKFASLSFFQTLYYFFLSLLAIKKNSNCNGGVAVSLTTYGWRYNFVFLTIESILSQSVKPSAIYLWVYREDKCSAFTSWILKRQCRRGLVIKFTDIDVRSYKKLSFMLKDKMPKYDHIITADDDVIYPNFWLQSFLEHPMYPTHVLCNRARVVTFEKDKAKLLPYRKWPLANLNNNKDFLLPTGVSGICYPCKSLDERVFAFESINQYCPYADDIWFKLLTFSNGYDSCLIQDKIKHYPLVITSLTKGLEKINVIGDLNDKQFDGSLKYFGLNDKIFKK